MLRKILFSLLVASSAANAATTYRDRHIPSGAPCMIELNGTYLNANLIKSVTVAEFQYSRYTGGFFKPYEYYPRKAMRVELINGQVYDTFDGDLFVLAAGVLKKIATCKE